jgi:hypothetical protein
VLSSNKCRQILDKLTISSHVVEWRCCLDFGGRRLKKQSSNTAIWIWIRPPLVVLGSLLNAAGAVQCRIRPLRLLLACRSPRSLLPAAARRIRPSQLPAAAPCLLCTLQSAPRLLRLPACSAICTATRRLLCTAEPPATRAPLLGGAEPPPPPK